MFARFRSELKQHGFRSCFRRYGWKVFALIFTGYLVRDLALYVFLPWWIAKNMVLD